MASVFLAVFLAAFLGDPRRSPHTAPGVLVVPIPASIDRAPGLV